MRCDNAVLCAEKHIVCLDRFRGYNVQCRSRDLAAVECICQILLHNQAAAAIVDQNHAILHLCDVVLVDQAFHLWEQRAMQENEIRTCEQFIQSHILSDLFSLVVRELIKGDHFHIQRIQNAGGVVTDPAKADTGLVFFRGDADAPTAIVNAGGGFAYVGAMHDSFPHCLELSKRGYNAFALIYRPGAQMACKDLARAIAYLHEHAGELGISMDGYSLWGGSAGGRMAAWIGAYGTEAFVEAAYPRPAACIVNYTGLSEVTGAEPPTYSAVGTSDWIADWRTMQARIERIQANGTDAQIEVFDGLPHGFGLGTGTNAEGWLDRAVAFWEKQL